MARKQQSKGNASATLNHVITELLNLDVEPALAKNCAEQVVVSSLEEMDIPSLVKEAYKLALQGGQVQGSKSKTSTRKTKPKPEYLENDIRLIAANAKKNQTSAYEGLKTAGIIKDNLVQQFIN